LNKRGLTFVEILTAVMVISITVGPVFFLFSTSKKTTMAARDLSRAMGYANSYISALAIQSVDLKLFETVLTPDGDLAGALSLKNLGVDPAADNYRRLVSLTPVPLLKGEKRIFHLTVKIEWPGTSGKMNDYVIERLVYAKK
jgi:hypothetical protein